MNVQSTAQNFRVASQPVRIPLDESHPLVKKAQADWFARLLLSNHWELTWLGIYRRHARGMHVVHIAKEAGVGVDTMRNFYEKELRVDFFGNMSYQDYCGWRLQQIKLEGLPNDPVLRLIASKALGAGLRVKAVTHRSCEHVRTLSNSLELDGGVWRISSHTKQAQPRDRRQDHTYARPRVDSLERIAGRIFHVKIDESPEMIFIVPKDEFEGAPRLRDGRSFYLHMPTTIEKAPTTGFHMIKFLEAWHLAKKTA